MSESPPSFPACPRCSAPLAPTAAQGSLCPRCLLAQGLAHSDPEPPPPPPELTELAPLFPELEIVELLGQGGMGAVYKARQRALDRWVALKILTPRPGDESGFAARFEREAHALARLAHPNVVGIHDSGRTQERCWLLMEYVEGASLRQLLRTGELDVPRALAIVRQICDALEFAHEQGIVHRDIKPENVLVDKKGRVKIADFGLAKIVGEAQPGEPITRTQQSMGTPQYMAPEQLTGSKNVDHRADIYSLGVVFYELLTGELPLGRFEPPSQRVQVDVRLDEVVLRALERAPERRYQHATEMKTGIEKLDQPAAAPALVPLGIAGLVATYLTEVGCVAFGLAPQTESRAAWIVSALVLLLLLVCSVLFRRDRRGFALRYVLGTLLVGAVVAALVRAHEILAGAYALLDLESRAADVWILRVLLVALGVEALRIAWSGRRELRRIILGSRRARVVDALVLLASAYLCGLHALGWPWPEAQWMLAHSPLAALLLAMVADGIAAGDPTSVARAAPASAISSTAGKPWPRRVALPAAVAFSAWVMARYTFHWGWFGAIASSAVLSLAVVGYLLATLPLEQREQLEAERAARRIPRLCAAFVVLAAGALALGAAWFGGLANASPGYRTSRPTLEDLEREWPVSEAHLAQMTALIAEGARDELDPIGKLAQDFALSSPIGGGGADLRTFAARAPRPFAAWVMIGAGALILVGAGSGGLSWRRHLRYACESLAVVALGLGAAQCLVWIQAGLHRPEALRPLVLQARLPFGVDQAQRQLDAALASAGFEQDFAFQTQYGCSGSKVLVVDVAGADVPSLFEKLTVWPGAPARKLPYLRIELAGDPEQWASAVRIDAGLVGEQQRGEWETLLTRLLQHTRRD